MVEKQSKKAKLSEKDIDLYHVVKEPPLAADELGPAVTRLFTSKPESEADERVLAGIAEQVSLCCQHSGSLVCGVVGGGLAVSVMQLFTSKPDSEADEKVLAGIAEQVVAVSWEGGVHVLSAVHLLQLMDRPLLLIWLHCVSTWCAVMCCVVMQCDVP